MAMIKTGNIFLSQSPKFLEQPALLCRPTAPIVPGDDGAWTLSAGGSFDFMTFFNALSVGKFRTYTSAESFSLHLELKGGPCTFTQTRADSFNYRPDAVEGTSFEIPASDQWRSFDIDLVVEDSDEVVAFTLTCEGDVELRGSYYSASVPDDKIREVELALCTTTFRKEDYIVPNIELVRKGIVESDEAIAAHFHMHVVDNGKTLDVEKLSGKGITIHPNPNVGGSGGYARGMIEAMEQTPRATHVLLMDDDVEILPESIIRTYQLLTMVNDEYAEAFVSGAMMNMDQPDERWEDIGFFTFDGSFGPLKPPERMSSVHGLVGNETFPFPLPGRSHADTRQAYAGWWFCVIPMTTIDEVGLPLPLFVRSDDTEYARRADPKIMTLNGICVWHEVFYMRYNPAVERYQVNRNVFISQSASKMAPLADFERKFYHQVQLDLKKFNYVDAELALEGLEDYMKGPDYISKPVAGPRFMDANRHKEKLRPFEEVAEEARGLGVDLESLTTAEVQNDEARSIGDRLADFATFNGQRFDPGYTQKDKVAVVDAAGWIYPAGKVRRADVLVVVDVPNRLAAIRRRDPKRFHEVWNRYKADMARYRKEKPALDKAYAAARPTLTSVDFWKEYLAEADAQEEAGA